jgi:hypothetical protein
MSNNPLMNHIDKVYYMMMDPGETGFITFEYKKQLLEAKWRIDECLEKASTYAGESEWIADRKAEMALNKISRSG